MVKNFSRFWIYGKKLGQFSAIFWPTNDNFEPKTDEKWPSCDKNPKSASKKFLTWFSPDLVKIYFSRPNEKEDRFEAFPECVSKAFYPFLKKVPNFHVNRHLSQYHALGRLFLLSWLDYIPLINHI